MRKQGFARRSIAALSLVFAATLCVMLPACSGSPDKLPDKNTFPRLDGAAAMVKLAEASMVKLAEISPEEAASQLFFTLTDSAYEHLLKGEADVVLAAAPSAEISQLARNRGAEFELTPIATDALVFFVNDENSIKSLTPEDIRNIYLGKTTSWNQVGGPNMEITAFEQPKSSDTCRLMLSVVMDGLAPINTPTVQVLDSAAPRDGDPLNLTVASLGDAVDIPLPYDNRPGALGYDSYYFSAPSMSIYTSSILSVNGIKPDADTIKSGKYPYTLTYYAVTLKSSPAGSDARNFVAWLSGTDGQAVVKEAGYVPIS